MGINIIKLDRVGNYGGLMVFRCDDVRRGWR